MMYLLVYVYYKCSSLEAALDLRRIFMDIVHSFVVKLFFFLMGVVVTQNCGRVLKVWIACRSNPEVETPYHFRN